MNHSSTRLVVYPKDVRNITGRGYRSSRLLLLAIRKAFGRSPVAWVTMEEFCRYMGLEEEFVEPFLGDGKKASSFKPQASSRE